MKLIFSKYVGLILAAGIAFAGIYNLAVNEPDAMHPAGPPTFTPGEKAWIKANPVITVGVDLDFAPIENMDSGGEYIGVTADFLSLVSRKTGLQFEIDHEHSWEESLERIRHGRVHMLGAAVPSHQRRAFMDFTQPYAWLSGVIIVRKAVTEPMSLGKLSGMKVTVVENYIWRDILERSHPELLLSPAPNIGAALNKVSFGMADAMVGYMATASHHIERLGISNLKISGDTVSVLDISFAVSRQAPELTAIIDKVLSRTTDTQKKAILRKWISLGLTEQKRLRWITRIMFPGVALILLGLVVIIIWNRSLQRQVIQRTETLNLELIQRTQMEKALRESEEKYRSIFGNIQDVYYEILPKGRIMEISPSVEKVFGYSRTDMLDRSMSRMFVDQEEFRHMLDKAAREERLDDHEALLATPDQKELNCSLTAVLIRDNLGEPVKIIGSIHNITDRVKAQKALSAAYKELEKRVRERTAELRHTNRELNRAKEAADAATRAKSNFLANMSHEIRTPLSGVISASELVMHESPPGKIARYINIIRTSGHALLGVIDDILDFSKIEAGKLEIEERPFRLDKLISRTTNLFRHKIAENQIRFKVKIAPDTPGHLKGDSFRIQQVLTNLLGNALKFTDRGGRITLSVSGEPGHTRPDRVFMEFSVEDSGIGINPEHQQLLFTPFSQIDAATTRKYGGSGLGLSICGQLIEMMEGTITVDSNPGKGSRFTFTLPLAPWEAAVEDPAQTPRDRFTAMAEYKRHLAGCRILVAEDTPTNQEIILAVLELAGIRPELADSGSKAVAAVRKKKFDAVLMDLQMPGMDGFEATREIRRFTDKTQLPVIAMTAHTLKEDKGKCMAAGMNGYIAKPVDHDRLFNTLIRLIPSRSPEHGPAGNSGKLPEKTVTKTRSGTGFPGSIAGINLKGALATLGVSEPVFLHILDTFFKNHESAVSDIEAAWADSDRREVITLVHSLKGSASGIGAEELYGIALDLERRCKDSDPLPEPDRAGLDILENALTIVLASIRTLLAGHRCARTAPGANADDPDQAPRILAKLEQALAFPELEELERLTLRLEAGCSHPLTRRIRRHITAHDHDLARSVVRELTTQLKGQAP